jgi:uncharacterized lipoprotein YbaY
MYKYHFLSKIELRAGLLLTALLLAACGGSDSRNVTFSGAVVPAGNGHIPKHASAHVSLVQQKGRANEKLIVAELSLHDLNKKPIHFTLTVRRGLIKNNGHYGLSAQILNANGRIRWATPVPVEVDPTDPPQAITLMLQAVGARSAFKRYRCGDDFQFAAKANTKQAILQLGHRRVTLKPWQLGNGLPDIYVDRHGNRLEFTAFNTALKLDGQAHKYCQRVLPEPPAKAQRSGKNNH